MTVWSASIGNMEFAQINQHLCTKGHKTNLFIKGVVWSFVWELLWELLRAVVTDMDENSAVCPVHQWFKESWPRWRDLHSDHYPRACIWVSYPRAKLEGMILIYKPEGNDQRVNPDIKGMIAFLPSLILVISNNKLTEKVWEQGRLVSCWKHSM